MRSFAAVTKRELRTILALPSTYAVACAYWIISGVFFAALFLSNRLPDLERYYGNVAATLVVLVPIVAMRSFAEERRTGVLDVVLSWPVGRTALALGKYVANTLFVAAMVSVMWVYVRQLSTFAQVEVGKSLAQYVGLLLLVAAFNAVALGISSRSSSPAGATFVSFGVLLALWTLDFVPGWMGTTLSAGIRNLAPTTHLSAAGRGVIDLGDALYFLALVVAGLGLAVTGVLPARRSLRRLRITPKQVVAAAAAAAAFGLLSVSPSVSAQADLTPSKRFTVSSATRDVIAHLRRPATITAFVQRGTPDESQVRSIVASFRSAGAHLHLTLVDPDVSPAIAHANGITAYNQVRIAMGSRSENVDSLTEVALTSALVRLSRVAPLEACFTMAHGERNPEDAEGDGYDSFRRDLERQGLSVRSVALAAPGGAAVLRGCSLVVIAGARTPFLPTERALLAAFLKDDGRMLILGVEGDAVRDQLNGLLREYGVAYVAGQVHDPSSLADDNAAVVAFDFVSDSPVTGTLKQHGIPVLLPESNGLEVQSLVESRGQLTRLVESSDKASAVGRPTGGPYVLAAVADRSRVDQRNGRPVVARTRIGVVGSADFASNHFYDSYGNAEFALRLAQWVARPDDLAAAVRDPGGVQDVLVTARQRADLIRNTVIVPGLVPLPLLALCLLRIRRG